VATVRFFGVGAAAAGLGIALAADLIVLLPKPDLCSPWAREKSAAQGVYLAGFLEREPGIFLCVEQLWRGTGLLVSVEGHFTFVPQAAGDGSQAVNLPSEVFGEAGLVILQKGSDVVDLWNLDAT
jgi:hypothetical protein